MDENPIDIPEDDKFEVNTMHVGKDTLQLINEDGHTIYFPLTKKCQKDREQQAEAFAEAMRQQGRAEQAIERLLREAEANGKIAGYNEASAEANKRFEQALGEDYKRPLGVSDDHEKGYEMLRAEARKRWNND